MTDIVSMLTIAIMLDKEEQPERHLSQILAFEPAHVMKAVFQLYSRTLWSVAVEYKGNLADDCMLIKVNHINVVTGNPSSFFVTAQLVPDEAPPQSAEPEPEPPKKRRRKK